MNLALNHFTSFNALSKFVKYCGSILVHCHGQDQCKLNNSLGDLASL